MQALLRALDGGRSFFGFSGGGFDVWNSFKSAAADAGLADSDADADALAVSVTALVIGAIGAGLSLCVAAYSGLLIARTARAAYDLTRWLIVFAAGYVIMRVAEQAFYAAAARAIFSRATTRLFDVACEHLPTPLAPETMCAPPHQPD